MNRISPANPSAANLMPGHGSIVTDASTPGTENSWCRMPGGTESTVDEWLADAQLDIEVGRLHDHDDVARGVKSAH